MYQKQIRRNRESYSKYVKLAVQGEEVKLSQPQECLQVGGRIQTGAWELLTIRGLSFVDYNFC
jgi:hypothetical protein